MTRFLKSLSRVREAFVHFPLRPTTRRTLPRRFAETAGGNAQQLLDAVADGIYGVDEDGRITFVNSTLCQLLGVHRADALLGRDHHHALRDRPADGHTVAGATARDGADGCALCAAVGSDEPARGSLCLVAGNEEPLHIEFTSRPGVKASGYSGTVVTIHEPRESRALDAQHRRKRSQSSRLVSVVEASPNLIVVGRSDGQVEWMNGSGRTMLGIGSDQDIRSYTIRDMFSADEMERILAEDMPALVRDGRWQGVRTLLSPAEGTIPVQVESHVHHDEDFPDGYYVTELMRDLRPQLEQERNLRLSESRLSIAETVARMGSWEWDPDKDSVKWSHGLYRLYGMEPGSGDETPDTWLKTLHPDDQERVTEICARVVAGVGTLDFVCRSNRADGTEMVVHSRGGNYPGARRSARHRRYPVGHHRTTCGARVGAA